MPIKTLILDRDGTLFDELGHAPQPGLQDMLAKADELGLDYYVVSNEDRNPSIEKALGIDASRFLYRVDCGMKGGKGYVQKVMDLSGSREHEIVYLGDSDMDMHEAAGSRVALFNAEWSNPGYRYGFGVGTLQEFIDVVERFFLKDHLWYFKVDGQDSTNRDVMFRALLDPDTCKDKGITRLLKERDPNFAEDSAKLRLATDLVVHLLASIYLDGMHSIRLPNKSKGFRKPLWCVYPGSDGGTSQILELFEKFTAMLLSMTYEKNLLTRHVTIQSSKEVRTSGGGVQPIEEQFNSVMVNPDALSVVRGNVVFVVDDFSTGSNAMETSRNLLYAAGAGKVIGISVGKYSKNYQGASPKFGVQLPKMGGPAQVNNGDFDKLEISATVDPLALKYFH